MSFIFSFLIIILVIGLFIIISVLGFIRSFLGSIFGFGKHKNSTQNSQSQDFQQPTSKSKIFDKKEGEYVDFEEMD